MNSARLCTGRLILASKNARRALLISVLLTLALYVIPFGNLIGYPLVLLSTLAHEMGHGIAAMLVGNDFQSLQLYADGSGMAMSAGSPGRLKQAIVSAGGLVGPAVVAAGLFGVGRYPRLARPALAMIGVALLVAVVLVVRNIFGIFFISTLGIIALAIVIKGSKGLAQLSLVFVAVQLALSVFSRGDYLFTDVAHTAAGNMPSDVANMANALFLPYWFWGGVCGGFSVLVLVLGLLWFLKR
jgi:hypothetical protein